MQLLPSAPNQQGLKTQDKAKQLKPNADLCKTLHTRDDKVIASESQIVQLATSSRNGTVLILTQGIADPVKVFIDYVKTIYRQREVETETSVVKWPPTPSKVYINLACIDRHMVSGKSKKYYEVTKAMVRDGNVDVINETTKGPIEFNDIANDIPSTYNKKEVCRRVILVEGAPGVGKSTFAKEFCRRWERGEIAQQYQLVLLIRLRDDRISRAKTLKDLIYHPTEGVAEAVLNITNWHGLHVMIILEGFDELPDSCRRGQSVLMELLSGKLLPLATVLVTSRPWATELIRTYHGDRIYQHIEILGFTSGQITQYIKSTIPTDKLSELTAYLDRHPQIRAGMYIPLNSAIVVTVYQESQDSECDMPKTLTELYTALVRTLLVRYLCSHPEYDTTYIQSFTDLPPAVYTKFLNLCEVAYNSIVNTSDQVQLIFTERDLPPDFDNLGFMDSVTELYMTKGTVSSHNFLHLTFQEFFAAVHISTMSLAEQLKHFNNETEDKEKRGEHIYKIRDEGRLKVVLRFVAGLTKLACFSEKDISDFIQPPSDLDSVSSQDFRQNFEGKLLQKTFLRFLKACVEFDTDSDVINWLFETQSNKVIDLFLAQNGIKYSFNHNDMLPMDSYALGYCIANSKCQWVLKLEEDESEEDGEDSDDEKASSGTQEHAMDSDNEEEDKESEDEEEGEEDYSEENLRMLGIGARSYTRKNSGKIVMLVSEFDEDVKTPFWSKSTLNILFTECKSIIKLQQLSLELLSCNSDITWPDLSELRVLILRINYKVTNWKLSNLFHHLSLESLSILCNYEAKEDFLTEDFMAITQYIMHSQNLKELCFYSNKYFEGVEAITKALASNQSLETLYIVVDEDYILTNTSAKYLSQFITNTTTLQLLYLYNSGKVTCSANGCLMMPKTKKNTTLQDLNVVTDELNTTVCGESEAHNIAELLKYDPNIDVGVIWTNIKQITDTGAVHLAQVLRNDVMQVRLDLSDNNTGAEAIAQALNHNSTLCRLDLSTNMISDAGAEALAQTLNHNSTLHGLVLSNNCISDAGAKALALALHHNSTLWELDLSNNNISDAGAITLAQALCHNSTLKELQLQGNDGIGQESTHQLIQSLTITSFYTVCDGLYLSRQCEVYATQCQHYHTVKDKIRFV